MNIIKVLSSISLIAIITGFLSALFLGSLSLIQHLTTGSILGFVSLPFLGLIMVYVYTRWGRQAEGGNNLLIESYRENKNIIPTSITPLVLISTLMTHLGGGSIGREGTAVQMGGGMASLISRIFKIDPKFYRTLLLCGIASGFGSIFGVPLAGAVFAFEFVNFKAFNIFNFCACLFAAILGHIVVLGLGVEHYKSLTIFEWSFSFQEIFFVLFSGVVFGLAAKFFVLSTEIFKSGLHRFIKNRYLLVFIGASVLAGIFISFEDLQKYASLSLPLLNEADSETVTKYDWALKSLFTSWTLALGFKGGEVTPLLVIGQTLGNAFSQIFSVSLSTFTKLGFVGVFAGASAAPIACAVMAAEIFGLQIFPYALVVCYLSHRIAGKHRIYNNF